MFGGIYSILNTRAGPHKRSSHAATTQLPGERQRHRLRISSSKTVGIQFFESRVRGLIPVLFTTFNVGWTSYAGELNERESSGINVAAVLFTICLNCWGRQMQLGAYGRGRDRRESCLWSCPVQRGIKVWTLLVASCPSLSCSAPVTSRATCHFPTLNVLLNRSFMSARLFIHIAPVTVGFSSFKHPAPFSSSLRDQVQLFSP